MSQAPLYDQAARRAESPALIALPQDVLNIEDKTRANLFSWRGQFSPQLAEALIKNFAPSGCRVLDPFVGSGTVLLEAAKLGHPTIGTEINPAAIYLARVYSLANVGRKNRRALLDRIDSDLDKALVGPLFLPRSGGNTNSRPALCALYQQARTKEDRILLGALIVTLDFYHRVPDRQRALQYWGQLSGLVTELPEVDLPVAVRACDARRLPLAANSIQFVLTSPPYINVFNYHQNYRASVEALGWSLLEVARSEIGSNRKHRQNRFLTVIQYCLDMASVFEELRRVCTRDAQLIFVVGRESNVRKTAFYNGEIVKQLATRCGGFELGLRQYRVFKNKFGRDIYEDVLHFSPGQFVKSVPVSPRLVAREILTDALRRAPDESRADLKDAVERVAEVEPSPFFDVRRAFLPARNNANG